MPPPMTAPAAEFAAARDSAVAAPLPGTAFLDVAGADAIAFLHGQLSNDVAGLAPGAAEWATYNSPKGRMLATMLVWRPASGPACRLALAADLAEPIRKRLSMFVLRSKVTVAASAPALSAIGVGGPAAAGAVRAALGVDPTPMRAVGFDDYGTAIGLPDGRVLVAVPADRAAATLAALAKHAVAADEPVWRWLAIRAGVAQITLASQERHVPQTANWEVLGGVSFTKGCYPGQEIVARSQHLGILKERAHPFHVAAPPPAPTTPVFSSAFGEQACGSVVDAVALPDGSADLIAVVQLAAVESGDVHVGTPDGPALERLPLPYALPASAPKRVKL